jgi:flagellar biogenesis protein FliO
MLLQETPTCTAIAVWVDKTKYVIRRFGRCQVTDDWGCVQLFEKRYLAAQRPLVLVQVHKDNIVLGT